MRTIKVEVTEKMQKFVWSPSSLATFCGDTNFVGGCGVRLFMSRFAGPTFDVNRKHFTFGSATHEMLENYHAGDTKPPLEQLLEEWLPNLWIATEHKEKFAKKFGQRFVDKLEQDLPVSVRDLEIPADSKLSVEELRACFPQVGDITKYLMQGVARRWMFLGYDSAADEDMFRRTLKDVFKEYYRRDYIKPISIEDVMEITLDGIMVRGRIDRVDARQSGAGYMVIDYKTSKKIKTTAEMEKDFQMVCYHVATKQKYNVSDEMMQVGLFFLKPETKVKGILIAQPMRLQIAEINQDMITKAAGAIRRAEEMVKSGQFHYVDSSAKWQCPWCDHYGLCGV